ncbi:protein kinase domain-containing protein [Falsiroseomonas sp. HW251]|uniref:serine/threonine-protein kinase n=1 Tax=Falsiroseomonas sp. HW251 TaxID=3390998 RepID=UPI003D313944
MTEPTGRLGKYELRGTLGRGAMGVVYDGWDPIIARRVAIKTVKIPDPSDEEAMEELARFRREAQAAGRLTHPNIVGVYDYGEADGIAYIVMEFVDGPTLKSLIEKQQRMALPEVARVMDDVLTGLSFSHARGIVHRDIKPANVMITSEGRAKIADFGIARIESSSMTQAGTVMGTPAYMSPEQFMGQTVDARTDIYSTGVLLYQLLTGERPFEGGMTAIMHKALHTDPPRPSELSVTAPPALDAVVARAMAKRPEGRWQSADAFAQALRAAIAAPSGAAAVPTRQMEDTEATMVAAPRSAAPAPPPPAPRASAPAAKKGAPVAAIAAGVGLVLAAAGGGAFFLLGRGEPPVPPAAQAPPAPAPQAAVTLPPTSPPVPATVAPPLPVQPAAPTPAVTPPTVPVQPAAPAPTAMAQPVGPPAQPAAPVLPPPTLSVQPAAPVQAPVQAPAPGPVATALPPAQPPLPPTPFAQPQQAPVAPPVPQPQAPAAQPQIALGPTPVPPPAPQPAQPAALPSAASARNALSAALPRVSCSLVSGTTSTDRVTLRGVVGRGAPDAALREAVQGAASGLQRDWRVNSFEGPYCNALDVLRPAAQAFGTVAPLSVALAGNATRLRDGELITPVVNTPDFPSYVYVSFLVHDGTLAHLHPTPTDPSRLLPAGAALRLGDPAIGGPAWAVGAPYGTDMIIAVASSVPLFEKPRPDDEDIAAYLRDLRTALDNARRRGGRLASDAWVLETVAR